MKMNFNKMKWRTVMVSMMALLLHFISAAQCVEPGELVQFSNSGQQVAAHQTVFVLTDGNDLIMQVVTSPFAAPMAEGNYKVYAINYRTGETDPVLTPGTNVKQTGASCVAVSQSPLEFSVCVCVAPGAPISFSTSNSNTAGTYQSKYVVTTSAGLIVNSSAGGSFNAPTGSGEFSVYQVNWLTGETDPLLVNGTAIQAIGGSCVAKSASPVRFRVCSSYDYGNLPVTGGVTWPVAYASVPVMLNGLAPLTYNAASNPFFAVYAGTQISTENETPASGTDSGNDGISLPATVGADGEPVNFPVTLNANASGRMIYYRLWFDWNNDGDFSNDVDFNNGPASYAGSVLSAGAVNVDVAVLPPPAVSGSYHLRLAVSDAPVDDTYRNNGPSSVLFLTNGEIEDYVGVGLLSTLPVKLNSFTAVKQATSSVLRWTTSFEENSSHFVVERSGTGGNDWTRLGTIAAAGFSNEIKSYGYTDEHPLSGANYYRLRQVDRDGKTEFSNVQLLRFEPAMAISLYPNPASKSVNIDLPAGIGSATVVLRDLAGRQILSTKINGGGVQKIALSTVVPGVYMVQLVNNGQVLFVEKLVIR